MEFLFTYLAFLLVVVVIASPILAIIALQKSARLERRLRNAEKELGALWQAREKKELPGASGPEPEERPAPAKPMPALPLERVQPPEERTVPEPQPAPATGASAPRITKPAPKPRPRIEWERWVGVRGAAAVGGIVLALAGLLFFRHAFEQGWITPQSRVWTGTAVGLAAIGFSEWLRAKRFRFTPAAAAAGGVVVLYASTWYAYRIWESLSSAAALPLMAIITAGCAFLSIRHRSQFVAILGLVGGFAAPLLLSMPAEHPIGLFGYLLLLDLGLLGLGQRMRWPSLAMIGVLGTFLVELVWTAGSLDSSFFPLALVSLGAFALIFSIGGQRSAASDRRRWFISQVGALLLPFAFATYFASTVDFGEQLWPLAILVGILGAGSTWIGRAHQAPWLATGAAAGALAMTATWFTGHPMVESRPWDLVLSALGLTILFQGLDLWLGSGEPRETPTKRLRWFASVPLAPAIVGVGFSVILLLAAAPFGYSSPWPWLVGALGLATLLHFQGSRPTGGALRAIGGGLAGLILAVQFFDDSSSADTGFPGLPVTFLWMAGGGLLLLLLALWSRARDADREVRWGWHAAAIFLVPLLFQVLVNPLFRRGDPWLVIGGSLGLALLMALPSVAIGRGRWYLVATLLLAGCHAGWLHRFVDRTNPEEILRGVLFGELGVIAIWTAWVFVFRRHFSATGTAWRAAALLPLLLFPTLDHLVGTLVTEGHSPWTPTFVAAIAGLALAATHFVGPPKEAIRHCAQRWFGAALAGFAALALARVVGHEVRLVAWALFGLGLAILWRWRETPGLKYGTLAAFGVTGMVLLNLLERSGRFPNYDVLVWNWTSYATIVPVVCVLGAAGVFYRREASCARNWEQKAYRKGRPWIANLLSILGALFLFVWLNLQIFDYFETSPTLRIDFRHDQARDLAMSIAWIVYAMVLLAVGMARNLSGLRWISLAFLILTLGKVFLHDLGDLEGLYRVGSLFGLALSLLVVSVLYQRFVFPRERRAVKESEG